PVWRCPTVSIHVRAGWSRASTVARPADVAGFPTASREAGMARSDPGGRARLARWSRWVGGRVLVAVALVASVGVAGAQPAAAVVKWQQVAAGERHTCGIRENGTLWCWGDNFRGQLGL